MKIKSHRLKYQETMERAYFKECSSKAEDANFMTMNVVRGIESVN
jgi:hypothetical protein